MPNWKEQIGPDEDKKFNQYAAELRAIQAARPKTPEGPGRALHTKPHVGVVGELRVNPLQAPLNQGPFATPGTFPLYLRFSNGTFGRQHDGVPDVRGVALKLVGVPGKKLIPGLEDKQTQDLLLIQNKAFGMKGPDEFIKLVRIAVKGKALLVPRLLAAFGLVGGFKLIKGIASMPKVPSMATGTFYTCVPHRYGEDACKLSIVPLQPPAPPPAKGYSSLRDDLIARLKTGPLEWSLRVQLFLDEATTPLEDASVEWPEDKSPFREIGRVVIPRQDVTSARGQEIEALVESLSFDPWHSVEALRPLGAVMRARSAAYRESTMERKAAAEPETVLAPG